MSASHKPFILTFRSGEERLHYAADQNLAWADAERAGRPIGIREATYAERESGGYVQGLDGLRGEVRRRSMRLVAGHALGALGCAVAICFIPGEYRLARLLLLIPAAVLAVRGFLEFTRE